MRFFEAGLADCEAYLLSNELFWRLTGSGRHPFAQKQMLTLGNLMLAKQRLQAGGLDQEGQHLFTQLLLKYDQLRTRWRAAWERKCLRSYHHRLVQWRNFIEELRHDPADHADRYRYEVRWRVILELLHSDLPQLDQPSIELLAGLDAVLHALTVPGGFIWERRIEPGFPRNPFWYLYIQVPT